MKVKQWKDMLMLIAASKYGQSLLEIKRETINLPYFICITNSLQNKFEKNNVVKYGLEM